MIKVKHLLDTVEEDDGERLWIEPIGLTLDLRQWCKIDQMMSHLGPSKHLADWFAAHPQAYEYFRGQYHQILANGPYRPTLLDLVTAGRRRNFTLVHHGDDPEHNTATALFEFLSELDAYVPPEP